jgi:cytochrome c oxidase subunit 3
MAELYDSNLLTSGKGAVGDDEGEHAKGTDPHGPGFGWQHMHGDHSGGHGHDGLVVHHFMDLEQQRESGTLGMWVFLATEVMFIGAMFIAYFVYRIQPPYFNPFTFASNNLLWFVGFINTLVLLSSSLTVVLAIRAAQLNNQKAIFGWLVVTLLLGGTFLGVKVYEYMTDYQEHLWPAAPNWTMQRENAGLKYFLPEKGFIPGTEGKSEEEVKHIKESLTNTQLHELNKKLNSAKVFYRFYYSLTGLHAFHMVVGMGVFIFLIVQAARGKYTPQSHAQVEISGLYWHFVDIVWIFLFPLLYLVR